ncbi:50S ribosomal protein L29 [Candidatus Woesearchaeota archaeon]|nr:MAG: 50S ribosomal protein L29 [Candidatus Woesearchaeota archaeon]
MKAKELRSLNKEEQEKKLGEAQFELMKMKSQVATGTTPKNPHEIKKVKKIIARIKTLQK